MNNAVTYAILVQELQLIVHHAFHYFIFTLENAFALMDTILILPPVQNVMNYAKHATAQLRPTVSHAIQKLGYQAALPVNVLKTTT